MSGYNVFQAVRFNTDLTVLHCSGTGVMRPWIAKLILKHLINLKVFYFYTYRGHDTQADRVSWFHITREFYPRVEFSPVLQHQVTEYIQSDAIVAQHHILDMCSRRRTECTPPTSGSDSDEEN